ncbi:MAG: DUF2306 domain-containing protein [Bacteroidota bacterium]
MKRILILLFFVLGAISMIAMSMHYLLEAQSGILRSKSVKDLWWYVAAFKGHVGLGLMAITSGPFQFLAGFRQQRPRLHKRLGYVYLLSVSISSLAGLIIAPFAMGGWITQVGFSILGLLWFSSTFLSLLFILRGDIQQHQRWTTISYALTFAAITQRTLLLIPLLTACPFMPIYQLSAWLPWLLNVSIAWWILRSTD